MKAFLGYLVTIIFAFLFTLFFDGRTGVVFLSVLIIAPIISISMTLCAKKRISFNIESSASVIKKGNIVSFVTAFKKRGVIPAPFIKMKLTNDYNFNTPEINTFIISLSSKNIEVIKQDYTAKIWGIAYIQIEEIVITDFLGLIHFNIYKELGLKTHSKRFEISPNIPEISANNELLCNMCDAVAYEDNEETKENSQSSSGFPGYEHKKYVVGDPIKKINWKLSSKKDELLVRLDEAFATSKQNIVVDFFKNNSLENLVEILNEEKIIESVLSMLMNIVNLGLECNVYFFLDNKWQHCLVETKLDIYAMQYNFSKYSFQNKNNKIARIPIDIMNENESFSTLMVFSSCFDSNLENELYLCSKNGINTQVIVGKIPSNLSDNIWLVNNNFEFKNFE